jgi:hypothetical protein
MVGVDRPGWKPDEAESEDGIGEDGAFALFIHICILI